MTFMSRPTSRGDFRIAIICALALEYDAVCLLFDEFWDEDGDTFGKAEGDSNHYTTGRIGNHHVVLTLLSRMGKVSAARATVSLCASYNNLRFAMLVGICGGVPRAGKNEILLGDVIASKTIVQYDFGKKYPNHFIRKGTVENNLAEVNKDIRSLFATFSTERGMGLFQKKATQRLLELQTKVSQSMPQRCIYGYPGKSEDKLFQPEYRHKHHNLPSCICGECNSASHPVCDEALNLSCDDLGCNENYLITRERLKGSSYDLPIIHIGSVASGDTVMKSGEDRDRIAKTEGIIAFEMEGAGICEELPCLVIKGVCDYSDCHKNKIWQHYAAATAASAAKAVLELYIQTDKSQKIEGSTRKLPEIPADNMLQCRWVVPFRRNQDFVGRESILAHLVRSVLSSASNEDSQWTAIEGLSGSGKTQIALEAVYLLHEAHPELSIYWVSAISVAAFETAYRDIGQTLGISDSDKGDINLLVKEALCQSGDGWLMVVDNADDVELLFGGGEKGLFNFLPHNRKSSILFATRNHSVIQRLDIGSSNVFCVDNMDRKEATELLMRSLTTAQPEEPEDTTKLLDILADLPLAITQTSAYMNRAAVNITQYLEQSCNIESHSAKLLEEDSTNPGRYTGIHNSVAAIWFDSFRCVSRESPLAIQLLKFMSFLSDKTISRDLLLSLSDDTAQLDKAVKVLQAYHFVRKIDSSESYEVHKLAQSSMVRWLDEKEELGHHATLVMQQLDQAVPFPRHENKDVWTRIRPHILSALRFRKYSADKKARSSLLFKVAEDKSLLGKYQDAQDLYREVVELDTQLLGARHPNTLSSLNNLATVLQNLGKYEEAESIYRQTFELKTELFGLKHPHTLNSMNNLALVQQSQGKYNEAEAMHRQALALRLEVFGPRHIDPLNSMNNLANTMHSQGKFRDAETMHQHGLALRISLLGPKHPDSLSSMDNLALTLQGQKRFEEAKAIHQKAFRLRSEALGAMHPHTLVSLDNLASVAYSQGCCEEAESIYRQVLSAKAQELGWKHPSTLGSLDELTVLLKSQGRFEEAIAVRCGEKK